MRASLSRGFGAVAVAIAFTVALMSWGCASPADSADERPDSAPQAAAPESALQAVRLYAMNPQDIPPFMESQGYAFISSDVFFTALNITRDDVFAPFSESVINNDVNELADAFCDTWLPRMASDMMSNPGAYGDTYSSYVDILETAKNEDGYAATVFFYKNYDFVTNEVEELEEYGPAYQVLHRMDAADLAEGQKPAAVVVTMYDLNHYGSRLTVDGENSYKIARAKALKLAELPEPQTTCAYADYDESVLMWAWGLCDAGGTECIYTLQASGYNEVRVSIAPADTMIAAYADKYGAESPSGLIDAMAASVETYNDAKASNGDMEKLE